MGADCTTRKLKTSWKIFACSTWVWRSRDSWPIQCRPTRLMRSLSEPILDMSSESLRRSRSAFSGGSTPAAQVFAGHLPFVRECLLPADPRLIRRARFPEDFFRPLCAMLCCICPAVILDSWISAKLMRPRRSLAIDGDTADVAEAG